MKSHMVTTRQGCVLDWYMKFSLVLVGVVQKILDHIRIIMIYEFIKLKFESQCITKIK